MAKKDPERASRPGEDNPEWTRDEIRRAGPALDVFGQVFGPAAAETLKRSRGRPPKAGRKVNQTLRLDSEVLEAYRRRETAGRPVSIKSFGNTCQAAGNKRAPVPRVRCSDTVLPNAIEREI